MDRRRVLKISGAFLGYSIAGGTVAAVMGGCKATADAKPADLDLFDDKTYHLINELTEIILPATDTPGAKAANVVSYIHDRIKHFSTEEEQKAIFLGLKSFDAAAKESFSNNFTDLKPEEQVKILENMAEEAKDQEEHIFNMLRQETIVGFFTSEVGATQVLNHDPIPGVYNGCMDYVEGDAAWSI